MRLVLHIDLRIEPREAQRTADRESERGKPAEPRLRRQRPQEDYDCGRGAEAERIGQAVKLGPEARLRLQRTRDPAINPVEHAGKDDGDDRGTPVLVDREADAGQAGTQRGRGNRIGDHRAQGQRARMDLGGRFVLGRFRPQADSLIVFGHCATPSSNCCDPISASTVSPATTFWPSRTLGSVPAGR